MYVFKIHNVARGELRTLIEKVSEALEESDEPFLDVSIPLLDFYPPISFEVYSDKERA